VMMPGMVGYRVCKDLKSDPDTKGVLVVFLTARGGAEVESTVKRSGGDELIVKPFEPKELREKVMEMLEVKSP